MKPGRDFIPIPVLSAPTPRMTVRGRTMLSPSEAFERQDSYTHQLMVPAKCRVCRGNWPVSVAGVCILLPAPVPISCHSAPGHHCPAQGSAFVWAAATTTTVRRMEQQLRQRAAALSISLQGDDGQKWSPSFPLCTCPGLPIESDSTQVVGNQTTELQCCEGNKWCLTNIYTNGCTSGHIYTLARGSRELQRCSPVLGS